MTLAEKIYNLLNKKWDFDEALEIYEEYGESDTLKFLFTQTWSTFIDKQLREAIKELRIDHPVVEHQILEERKEESKKEKRLPERISYPEEEINYPQELQQLVLKRKGLFASANHSRYMLFTKAATEEERKALAFKIKADWREIERIWGILNFWKEHKTISPDIINVYTGDMTVKEMTSRVKNLRSYISKVRSGKKKYKMTLEQMQSELSELERRLNGIV